MFKLPLELRVEGLFEELAEAVAVVEVAVVEVVVVVLSLDLDAIDLSSIMELVETL